MKKTSILLILALFFACSQRQQNDNNFDKYVGTDNDSVSNSFEASYRKSNPSLEYNYDDISQIHNYSNNWDLDTDGIKDEVYFVGIGGAHLYYFLKVVLSTDNKPREFNFIASDYPIFKATDTFNYKKEMYGFTVTNIGKNLIPTIIIQLDEQTYYDNIQLKKRNIKTKNVLISFEKGITIYDSFL